MITDKSHGANPGRWQHFSDNFRKRGLGRAAAEKSSQRSRSPVIRGKQVAGTGLEIIGMTWDLPSSFSLATGQMTRSQEVCLS